MINRQSGIELSERVENLAQSLRHKLSENALDEETKKNLTSANLNKLIPDYVQWADKFIRPAARTVLTMEAFDCSQLSKSELVGFRELVEKIENGENLQLHLSHRAYPSLGSRKSNAKGIGWSDSGGTYDMFLNAYGIHHLHIAPTNKNGKRKGNSDTLLFAGFFQKEAVLVMLGTHKSFNDGSLLNAAANFQAANGLTMNGVSAPRNDWSKEDHQSLLRHGLSASMNTEHGVVPAMLASAGNGMMHMMHSTQILRAIRDFDNLLDTKDGRVKIKKEQGWEILGDAELEYGFDYCHFALFDTINEKQIFTVPWRR